MLFPEDKIVKNCKKCGHNIIIDKEELEEKKDGRLRCSNCNHRIENISSEEEDFFFHNR